MSTSRKQTLVDLFQRWGVVVTSPGATGSPIEKLQDLADFAVKTLVECGDLETTSPADLMGRINDILATKGLSPEAIGRWWGTPLIGLGMRVPYMMLQQDPDRVAAIAREVELPKTRKATREAEEARRVDAQMALTAHKQRNMATVAAREAQLDAASEADLAQRRASAARVRPRPSADE